ncbi:PKD domain-containing protein [Flavobacterium tegetincola]|uniref:T9SS type A sorting domain-containing protein n=1 Tax=Flavobacterium tegetincola TaxID=150172 RepID=UPI0004057950|nr:PKD domain-containing protein [Flavobacterium tegetincola]
MQPTQNKVINKNPNIIKQITLPKQKIIFVLTLFALFFTGILKAQAQPPPGIALFWDKQVGCQIGGVDDKRFVFFEDIQDSECIRVCDQTVVNYDLENLPGGATTTWTVAGGTLIASTNSSASVHWQNVGLGSITLTIVLSESTITKTLCIEKIELPTANFAVIGQEHPDYFETCSQQVLHFSNLSSANSGSALMFYLWDFGDGSTSTAFEPAHSYANDGNYTVTLTVTNACNCKSVFKMQIIAKRRGFEISCPTVVCEGQSAIYSLPFNANQVCGGNNGWSVIGGQIISYGNSSIEVLWNNVDATGFGYVTFDPSHCDLPCRKITTVKVPVIQAKGTIQGDEALCVAEQGRYKLPQWPTTDITWEILGNVNNNLAQIILTDQRNEIIVVPAASGTLILRAVYTNTLLGCSGQAEFKIQVADPLSIIGANSFCQNSSGTFTNTQGAPVQWTLKNATNTVVASGSDASLTYLFSQAGTYKLSVTSPNFCSVDEKTIVVLAKPAAPTSVTGEVLVCPSAPYSYSITNPDANSIYTWSVTNGSIIGSAQGDEVNISFNGTFPATISVFSKTIGPLECTSSPLVVTVNQVPVNAVISPAFSTVCSSSIGTYKAFKSGTSNLFTGGDSYTWSLSDPALGSITTGQGTTEVDVLFNEVATVTTVNLILAVGKCTISPAPQFVKQITINPKAQIKITALPNPACGQYNVTYTVSSINGVPLNSLDVVTWNLGNGPILGVADISTTFVNNSSTNIDYVVTAFINNANGCGPTNTASFTTTVLPNPPAVASISTLGNAFCEISDVNTVITVSSNTAGSFQWFKNGSLIPTETGTSLTVGPALNFGAYTFKVTSSNGCIRESNVVNIYKKCGSLPGCTINATVQNNSYLSACGTITFAATTSPAPISSSWSVLGTRAGNFSVSGNTLTGVPGVYTILYETVYPCSQGGTGKKVEAKQVIIPYAPEFSYIAKCNPDNTFNVNFIDNSNFYDGVSPKNVRFFYKLASASSFTYVPYNPSVTVDEIQNLPAGNYVFRVENDGVAANTPTIMCFKEYTVNLQGIDESIDIVVISGLPVDCHNTPVKFGLNPVPFGNSVEWDFGDGATNTALSPSRVYTVSEAPYTIKCTITNPFGCSIIRWATVYIPKKCFTGDIIATPSNTTVCKGDSVELKYVPSTGDCEVANYTWMNGSAPVLNAPNASTLNVATPGFYWVKVSSANSCDYNTPTQITPTFKTLPSVKIKGQFRYCENESILLTAVTTATSIVWKIDGIVKPQFNNMTTADFSGMFSPATFVISCTVSDGVCSNTASHSITVEEAVLDIQVDVAISCDPYKVVITANAVTNSSDPVHYNWSNGAVGNSITVNDGGAFSVTASTGGGCSFTKQIDVPKSPENYMWIFPTGCYTDCIRKGNYLIGPLLPLQNWSWNNNGQSVSSGSGFASPFTLYSNGNYSMTINTGMCDLESGLLSFSNNMCGDCEIKDVKIEEVKKVEAKYCAFTQILVIHSGASQPFQATISDPLNHVLIIPASFTLVPGANVIEVTIIPQSPFMGGTTTLRIHGQISEKEGIIDCEYLFPIKIPYCEDMEYRKSGDTNKTSSEIPSFKSCTLYPNPASGTVQVQYDLSVSNAVVELYDLTGRLLNQKALGSAQGTATLNISGFPAGVYIVAIRNENQILYQQKLIIK